MKVASWLGRCDDETESSTCRGSPLLRSLSAAAALLDRRRRRRRRYRVARMNRVRDCLAPRRTRTQIYNGSGGCAAVRPKYLVTWARRRANFDQLGLRSLCFDKRAVGFGQCIIFYVLNLLRNRAVGVAFRPASCAAGAEPSIFVFHDDGDITRL